MIKREEMDISGKKGTHSFIETYIDAANGYGALKRRRLRLLLEDGKIVRVLEFGGEEEAVTLLGVLGKQFIKKSWFDLCKL
mgnify:CR=1 FL=1